MGYVIFIVLAVVVGIGAYFLWDSIKWVFRDSETLFWARFQMFFGALWEALLAANLAPVLEVGGWGRFAAATVILQGIATEVVRRLRATDL